MQVKIQKLRPEAVIPSYAKPGDAGMDFTAINVHKKDGFVEYKTGIAIEIPEGYVGLLFPRSSVTKKSLTLANSVGVIDSGYRGEICFRFKGAVELNSQYPSEFSYNIGDKIGQIIILPYPQIEFLEVNELSETERGAGGYGSTGN